MLHRFLSIPALVLATLAALASAPLWVPLAGGLDLLRGGRSSWLRACTFGLVYLLGEVVALTWVAGIVLCGLVDGSRGSPAERRRLATVQHVWPRLVLEAGMWLYDLRIEVEGDERVEPGPLVILANHNSVGDTALPAWLVADRHGIMVRYTAKDELRWDPCLDVLGTALDSVFVRRGGVDPAGEAARIGRMVEDLPADEAVFVYPEGTRATPAKRARILEKLEQAGDDERLAYARRLRRLLPPRLGGPLELLVRNPGADVLLFRHVGFEEVHTWGDLASGRLVGRTLRIHLVRYPYAELPRTRGGLERWLLERWIETDAWVADALEEIRRERSVGGTEG